MSGALRRVSPLARDLALLVAAFAVLRVVAVAGLGAHRFNDTRSYFSLDLLGDGVRLFENPGPAPIELETTRVVDAPGVTHIRFRIVR